MLIDEYDLELFTPPCEPGAETWCAIARLKVDISQALPYLNASLRGAVYNHAAKALTWKKGGRNIAFHPYEIATANLEDRAAADRVGEGLIKTVNRTWERREEMEPEFEKHRRPTPMALFKLLPGTNCRQCGEQTCFIFATKLAASQRRIEDCLPLLKPGFADNLAGLKSIVIDAPSIG